MFKVKVGDVVAFNPMEDMSMDDFCSDEMMELKGVRAVVVKIEQARRQCILLDFGKAYEGFGDLHSACFLDGRTGFWVYRAEVGDNTDILEVGEIVTYTGQELEHLTGKPAVVIEIDGRSVCVDFGAKVDYLHTGVNGHKPLGVRSCWWTGIDEIEQFGNRG